MGMYRGMVSAFALALVFFSASIRADSAEQIDAGVERALAWLNANDHTRQLVRESSAMLVFPDMVRMGFGVGGEFGEGALLFNGETNGYYASAGTVYGVPREVQYKAEVVFFMNEFVLRDFRSYQTWRPAGQGSIRIVATEAEIKQALEDEAPIIGLVFTSEGLVQGLTMGDDRITRVAR